MKRILKYVVVGLLGAVALAYAIDTVNVMFPGKRNLYEDVRVDQVYTDTNKYKELEYSLGTSETQRCVYALFPHGGNLPCWYLKKHTMKVTNTD